jgi:hypothetical protein
MAIKKMKKFAVFILILAVAMNFICGEEKNGRNGRGKAIFHIAGVKPFRCLHR